LDIGWALPIMFNPQSPDERFERRGAEHASSPDILWTAFSRLLSEGFTG
jgi:hypothetical protein